MLTFKFCAWFLWQCTLCVIQSINGSSKQYRSDGLCQLEFTFLDMLICLNSSPTIYHVINAQVLVEVLFSAICNGPQKNKVSQVQSSAAFLFSSFCCKDYTQNQMNKEENYSLYFRVVKGFSVSDSLAFFCHFLT